jgi:hypothetical protein
MIGPSLIFTRMENSTSHELTMRVDELIA